MIINDKKLTGRQKRMQHFKDMHARSGLNLVSLMDIFTILVFFLLVNTSAQQLPSRKDVKLPTSVSTKTPKENLVIAISKENIIVAGHKVADLQSVLSNADPVISSLLTELQFQASKYQIFKEEKDKPHSVTIMGDENIPYKLLSKILSTCRQANYTNIAFAAYQKKKG
jgi:biopolymer transport protein TolR